MRWIGLLGGMSWESTVMYYKLLNTGYNKHKGGLHSAPVIMLSVDFAPLAELMHQGKWEECGEILAAYAGRLEKAGAEAILLCTNTMHKVAPMILNSISIPFLHICDAVGAAIRQRGLQKVALLGTLPTMEADFYRNHLVDRYGLEVMIPHKTDRVEIDRIIFNELCLGTISADSRKCYLEIIEKLGSEGAQGIILGCTEIGMLVNQQDTSLPLFDTTHLHVESGLKFLQE